MMALMANAINQSAINGLVLLRTAGSPWACGGKPGRQAKQAMGKTAVCTADHCCGWLVRGWGRVGAGAGPGPVPLPLTLPLPLPLWFFVSMRRKQAPASTKRCHDARPPGLRRYPPPPTPTRGYQLAFALHAFT